MFDLEDDVVASGYDEGRFLMTAPCRRPTQEELSTHPIIWLTDHCFLSNAIARRKSTAVKTPSIIDPTTSVHKHDEPEIIAKDLTSELN